MAPVRIVGFSGNPSRPSRTRSLVETVATGVASRLGGHSRLYDLSDLGPSLGSAQRVGDLDARAAAVIAAIVDADLLVLGSPTYKGSYSGLFKHVFDLIDPFALTGKPVILTATGGSDRHALIIEHQLRPLLGFFAAHSAPTGIYASESDFTDGRVTSEQVLGRIRQSVVEIERFFPSNQSAPALLAAE